MTLLENLRLWGDGIISNDGPQCLLPCEVGPVGLSSQQQDNVTKARDGEAPTGEL